MAVDEAGQHCLFAKVEHLLSWDCSEVRVPTDVNDLVPINRDGSVLDGIAGHRYHQPSPNQGQFRITLRWLSEVQVRSSQCTSNEISSVFEEISITCLKGIQFVTLNVD